MEQHELLALATAALERLHVPYLVTGSMATIFYGEPRLTNDIDIVAKLRPEQVRPLVQAFPAPDFYVSDAAITDALRQHGQFNVIHPASGLKIDIIIPADSAFERSPLRPRGARPARSGQHGYVRVPGRRDPAQIGVLPRWWLGKAPARHYGRAEDIGRPSGLPVFERLGRTPGRDGNLADRASARRPLRARERLPLLEPFALARAPGPGQ